MITIEVNNAETKIQGLAPETEKGLKAELKYLNQAISYSYHQNLRDMARLEEMMSGNSKFGVDEGHAQAELRRLRHIVKGQQSKLFIHLYKDGLFPTGLLPKVLKLLQASNLEYQIVDRRLKPKSQERFLLKESLPLLRYYQRTASRLAKEKCRGIIVKPTGTGKTLTVARMIWELEVMTLVITPSKAITDNMVDTLTKYFGKGKVQKLTTKTAKLKAINVVNIQAMVKMKPELFKEVGAVFIDEFHHSAAETYQEINRDHLKHVYYRIGVTATNFRNDGSDLALESVLSEVLYEYSIEQAIKDGFLVKPEFVIKENKAFSENGYQKEYKNALVLNETRNSMIAEIVKTHEKESVLVLVQQVEHGEALKAMIPGSEFIHGEENDTIRQRLMEDYRKGKIKCLIGTSVIGEGVDLPCASVLIMAGGGKAKSQIMQNIGRVLRPFEGKTKALVYDFMDRGTNFLEEHSFLRREIYKQYDFETIPEQV